MFVAHFAVGFAVGESSDRTHQVFSRPLSSPTSYKFKLMNIVARKRRENLVLRLLSEDMNSLSAQSASLFICLVLLCIKVSAQEAEKRDVYVVYMGAAPADSSANSLKESHLRLLASVLKRGARAQTTLVRSYQHGFSGFAARLSKEEAATISKKAGVVSVFVDPILQLHTTRSWDFLQLQTSVETSPKPNSDEDAGPSPQGSDTIIGLLDTGIWPESKSFSDGGMSEIPSKWNGTCVNRPDFNSSNCNKKLIGARYYVDDDDSTSLTRPADNSPRDELGHGTHTASTAAGSAVLDASYYGLASGTAKGGSTSSRIAMYRVCGSSGCPGSAILKGFDDAIADGVDIISVSLGASRYFRPDFDEDPIAIGAFHAVAKGITVVCSAGNDGPTAATVVNAAPWMITVAATTIDRDFESDVMLGGNNGAIKGEAINFSNLSKTPAYPLIYGKSARSNSSSDDDSASHCEPDALDGNKIKGKIVLCKHSQNDTVKSSKTDALESSGAIGAILVNDLERTVASTYVSFPVTEITSQAGDQILTYINSTKNPVATILPTITVSKYKPAPQVAYFSSRGPSQQASNILKPDIAAPGVNILAAWIPQGGSSEVPAGQKPSDFNLVSGTSMACPHVSGIAASIKAWNPGWSPAAVRSAIMTTATQVNNEKNPLTTDSGSVATPFDYGAGEVNPSNVLQPGLVYDAGTVDYMLFLCNYGYEASKIKLITKIPDGFQCPKNSSKDLISNLNYPSIAVTEFSGRASRTVSRTVTNVGAEEENAYVVSIKAPSGLDVKVKPNKLQFTKNVKKLNYQVTFSADNSSVKGDLFGWITWSDGKHRVRSPFVVSSS